MSLTMISKTFIISFVIPLFVLGCSSTPEVPTTDVCSFEKHWKDNIFQVKINDEPINRHYYIYDEAVEIAGLLAKDNKCRAL